MGNQQKLIPHTDRHMRFFLAQCVLSFDLRKFTYCCSKPCPKSEVDPGVGTVPRDMKLAGYQLICLTFRSTSENRGSLHVAWPERSKRS